MKKGYLAFALAASMMLGTVSMPAFAEESDEEINLVFAWWGNQLRNDRTQEVLDLYTEKNPNITFDSQPAQWSDYWTKLATAAAGNTMPDLLQMGYSAYIGQYVESGLLEDLTPYVESGALDVSTIDQGILDSGSVDGKRYCICSGLNVPALIYNKTLIDELELEIPNQMTVEEFEAIAKEIYEKSGVRTDLGYGNAASILPYILRGEGIATLYDEDGQLAVEAADFVPFFEIYQKGYEEGWMLDAGIFAELTVNSVEQSPLVYFSSESTESWCACNWSNQLAAFNNTAPEGMELTYATWPAKDPDAANYLHPSMYFCVSANSENKDAAVEVLNYLINDIDCNSVLLAERGIPAPSAVAEGISELLSDESQQEIAFIADVVTPHSSTISPIGPSGENEMFAYANELVEMILFGQMTAEEAAEELYAKGCEVLAE